MACASRLKNRCDSLKSRTCCHNIINNTDMEIFDIFNYGKGLFQVSSPFAGFETGLQWGLFDSLTNPVAGWNAGDFRQVFCEFPGLVIATTAQAAAMQGYRDK